MSTPEDMRLRVKEQQDLCRRIREMLVARLDLPFDVDWITDDQPLFGRGLELDSVDALEISIGVNALFGASLEDDDREAFGSVAKLAERISDQL
ncbi:acyl carrier protein [Streptomyces sp. DvalAA-14]|uniref:acyl carrier protein n=1 Tax=unclassified Streptomyces TaxID=2593676 RepID=UPI00081B3101|nr:MULTISPECIES: phosphopantetheine-binding protein [unclassified Streptomyces]MYS21710.1 acyl carrier protein [Streptomyces sp. SID4948]SCD99412.1 acyl carrier protein [Streptomyces sp. DvalAA-14]